MRTRRNHGDIQPDGNPTRPAITNQRSMPRITNPTSSGAF
jgi:hypothetical protein